MPIAVCVVWARNPQGAPNAVTAAGCCFVSYYLYCVVQVWCNDNKAPALMLKGE